MMLLRLTKDLGPYAIDKSPSAKSVRKIVKAQGLTPESAINSSADALPTCDNPKKKQTHKKIKR